MRDLVLVFLGGGVGSALRWLTGLWALRLFGPQFPSGTLIVNVIGCFIMGVLFRVLPAGEGATPASRLLLMTGVLGGFTTFSAFALDAAGLWLRQEAGIAAIYVGLTVASTLLGVAIGLFVGRLVWA